MYSISLNTSIRVDSWWYIRQPTNSISSNNNNKKLMVLNFNLLSPVKRGGKLAHTGTQTD